MMPSKRATKNLWGNQDVPKHDSQHNSHAFDPVEDAHDHWARGENFPSNSFFKSLYYFGDVQLRVDRRNSLLREMSPFVASGEDYWISAALKVAVQATFFLDVRLCAGLNAVGIGFKLHEMYVRKSLTLPPPAFRAYATCPKNHEALFTLFNSFDRGQHESFCRWVAGSPPLMVWKLMEVQHVTEFMDDNLFLQLIHAVGERNEDVYETLCYIRIEKSNFTDIITKIQLKSLEVSHPSEKDSQLPSQIPFNPAYALALSFVIAMLPHNDRAHAAQCSQLWNRVAQSNMIPLPLQRNIPSKLFQLLKPYRQLPIDTFSKGQILVLLQYAKKRNQLENVVQNLEMPTHTLEVSKVAAEFLQEQRGSPFSYKTCKYENFLDSYEIFKVWRSGTLTERDKETVFIKHLRLIVYKIGWQLPVLDPLAILILEQGYEVQVKMLCSSYLAYIRQQWGFFAILYLMQFYLNRSKKDFQKYFLEAFEPHIKAACLKHFDLEKAYRVAKVPLYDQVGLEKHLMMETTIWVHSQVFQSVLDKLASTNQLKTRSLLIDLAGCVYYYKT